MKIALCVIRDIDNGIMNLSIMEEKIIEAAYEGADLVFFSPNVFSKKEISEDDFLELVGYCNEYAISVGFGFDDIYQVYDYVGKEIFDSALKSSFVFEKQAFCFNKTDNISYSLQREYQLTDEQNCFGINIYNEISKGGAFFNGKEVFLLPEEKEDILYINV